jgi:hypothetical protein
MASNSQVPVETVAVQAGLLLRLQAAREACDRIASLVGREPCTEWVDGRAEGTALHAARVASQALGELRIILQIRLDWPDVEPVDVPCDGEAV